LADPLLTTDSRASARSVGEAVELAPFLKPFYAPALTLDGRPFDVVDRRQADNELRYTYTASQRGFAVGITYATCEPQHCQKTFEEATAWVDELATSRSGEFRHATRSDLWVDWKRPPRIEGIFAFRLRNGVMVWRYQETPGRELPPDYFERLRAIVNRDRFEEAVLAGNVATGNWAPEIYELAKARLKDGRRDEAVFPLKVLQTTAPTYLEAQLELAALTGEPEEKRKIITAVYDNAEDPALQEKAAALLNRPVPKAAELPLISRDPKGLQVVLIPLGRADVRLMADAAKLYQGITGIPASLARLPEPFLFERPERVADQRILQNAILKSKNQSAASANFSGWTFNQYEAELMKSVAGGSALARYKARAFLDQAAKRDGQYASDIHATRLAGVLAPLRSPDRKVIYVGVTEANIYAGDSNFVFSTGGVVNGAYIGLLSYSMMTAAALDQPNQSRKRLVERLAKELVPATLKGLDIARPADPSDPYSYADGVTRLDEKRMELSPPTKAAIDRLR